MVLALYHLKTIGRSTKILGVEWLLHPGHHPQHRNTKHKYWCRHVYLLTFITDHFSQNNDNDPTESSIKLQIICVILFAIQVVPRAPGLASPETRWPYLSAYFYTFKLKDKLLYNLLNPIGPCRPIFKPTRMKSFCTSPSQSPLPFSPLVISPHSNICPNSYEP